MYRLGLLFLLASGAANAAELKPYYGLLHAHTEYSDGKAYPIDAYLQAELADLDFFSLTDHLEYLQLNGRNYQRTQNMADAMNFPGAFVALYGFEWGGYQTLKGWMNHINVIGAPTLLSVASLISLDLTYLEIQSFKTSVVGQFNHPGTTKWRPLGMNNWNDYRYDAAADTVMALMRIDEGKHREENGYIPALDKGWHLSPQFSEDTHDGKFVTTTMRTGVWAPKLNRREILNALKANRSFYTTDKNAWIRVEGQGWLMGDRIPWSKSLHIDVLLDDRNSGDKIQFVELVSRGGAVVMTLTGLMTMPYRATFVIEPDKNTYYFVRAVQKDGDRLISAPVFVED